ncbi:MAG TPA: HigA family addiction module antitoxin [Spirochaetota bacterium]|nr:HigA family addiction module antitoxin [Spirochaetota bacterium]
MQEKRTKNLAHFHPGEILLDEFLLPFNITNDKLSKDTNISINEINELITGKMHINEEIASRLADFFGTTPQFWLSLQSNYDSAILK